MRRMGLLVCLLTGLAAAPAARAEAARADGGAAPHGLGARLASALRERGLPEEVVVAVIATLPIVELRGAIPVGNNFLGMRDRWWITYLVAVAGNMLPVPFILLLLGPLSRFFMRFAWGRRFFEWLFARTRRKTAEIEKYETLGLAVFVAIPLPATGGWTGAMAAFLMGIGFRHAMWSILLGVLIAGVVITVLSLLGWWGALLAGGVLLALAVGGLLQLFKREAGKA